MGPVPRTEYGALRVLLVEDNRADADFVREALVEEGAFRVALIHVERLGRGLEVLRAGAFDAVLLDLSLPDAWELEGVGRLRSEAPEVPVVVLTGSSDEAFGMRALRHGAQDYLHKGQVTGPLLVRSLRYAVERQGLLERAQQLEREREAMRVALAQGERLASLGLLSAGIAHEVNNPLAFVIGNLFIIERDVRALMAVIDAYEPGREALAAAVPEVAQRVDALAAGADLPHLRESLGRIVGRTLEGARRIGRIIEALRSLARTERPEVVLTDLPELARPSIDAIRGRAARQGVAIVTDWEPEALVRCAPTLLAQALLNLLTNALYAVEVAHPGGGGSVLVGSCTVADETVIEVADDGCGVPPEVLSRLFDPFYSTKPIGEGIGLGLSITHAIVASHGGRIEVESAPGEGARFRIHLPLRAAEGADGREAPPPGTPPRT